MRIVAIVLIFVSTLVFTVIGSFLVALSFNVFTVQTIADFLRQTFMIQDLNFIIGGIGLFLIVANIFISQVTLGKMQREKTIAFNNPDGQVTVSLSALEDFIKRLASSLAGLKDLRCNVIAGKKEIEINTRVTLWDEANIPETTENIQSVIKSRIQEMLGIEEPLVVRVHVMKILRKEKKLAKKKEKESPATPPFQGSIEYGKD